VEKYGCTMGAAGANITELVLLGPVTVESLKL
jgi:hypothetical protein